MEDVFPTSCRTSTSKASACHIGGSVTATLFDFVLQDAPRCSCGENIRLLNCLGSCCRSENLIGRRLVFMSDLYSSLGLGNSCVREGHRFSTCTACVFLMSGFLLVVRDIGCIRSSGACPYFVMVESGWFPRSELAATRLDPSRGLSGDMVGSSGPAERIARPASSFPGVKLVVVLDIRNVLRSCREM